MSTTNDTLALIKEANSQPLSQDALIKAGWAQAGSATSGITMYDLEAPAKLLFPVLTPLRNKISRVVTGLGTQANWRAVTGLNTLQLTAGVAEGKRGGAETHATADYLAAYRGIGMESFVNFEADYAAKGFDDVKALAVQNLLRAVMIQEEQIDLGGNTSVALGQPTIASTATATTGGSLTDSTAYKIYVVALTLAGYQQVKGVNNGSTGSTGAIAGATLVSRSTRTNADGTTDTVNMGVSQPSAVASQTTGAPGTNANSITAVVTPVAGAVAYAWFWGTVGNELLGAVTTINSVSITATATGTTNVSTLVNADCSQDSLVYDGLLTQIMKSGSGAYVKDLATGTAGTGSALTSDGAAGIVEIEDAFQSFWDLYRLSPDEMFVGSNVYRAMNKLILANGSAPLVRYNMDVQGVKSGFDAGVAVTSYMNKITGQAVKITVHPNMPQGMIMFYSNSIPYPISNVGNIVQKKLRRDYYQIEWALRSRKYEYGLYFDGVLQNYFPPAFGIIKNIAA